LAVGVAAGLDERRGTSSLGVEGERGRNDPIGVGVLGMGERMRRGGA
jgi:hypothetical protein